jgi:PAS domain S-box-containing protein
MKKLIVEFLNKHFNEIADLWTSGIEQFSYKKLTNLQVRQFVDTSLRTFIDVLDKNNYQVAEKYLADSYYLFANSNLNLLEISQLFSQARFSLLNIISNENTGQFDPIILIGYMDDIIEQIYARYSMLHQENKLKQLESDRDRLASKLELNQEYLDNILHSSDSAIMIVDKSEKFIAWNKGAERIFGYSEDEILGNPSSFLLPSGKKYFDELDYIKEHTMRNDQVLYLETERKTKEGKILSVKLSVSKLPSNEGEYLGRSIIIKDFTEFKKLQAQIDQSEKLAVIGQLAAGVAHEIGNPLASISSLVQILQRKSQEPFINEQLSNIKENIDRITRIVRELVDFSRPPSYELAIQDITDIIKTALGIVKYDKRIKKISFNTDLKDDLPKVNVAADQLLQVFINILINALDATEGRGQITVKSNFDKNNIYVEISDDGCGMDDITMSKIFDPFFTTKDVGKGTGLGLSVSYGIIKRFNGEIIVESIIGKGSKFTVVIPIEKN